MVDARTDGLAQGLGVVGHIATNDEIPDLNRLSRRTLRPPRSRTFHGAKLTIGEDEHQVQFAGHLAVDQGLARALSGARAQPS